MSENHDGFEIPIHQSLINPILVAGLPRSLCFILWTTAGALGFGMRQVWFFAIAILIHFLLSLVSKKDPYFFDVLIRAIKNPKQIVP